ncbi:MAG: tRNA-dihydrouridine synthase family protein [Anaerolineales bacterium]|nr:tRNA-dihydrouridine synthase family protein [Anaerolineales bacterium]
MNGSFWDALPRPIIGLAPMYGITDHPYRHIQKKYGNPAVVFTEFVQVEELCAGVRRALNTLRYDESQRPIVAQLFGHTPRYFRRAALVIAALGFDGIDINMGCPTKSVAQSGAGAALIRTPDLARAIIDATHAGVRDWVEGAGLREGSRLSTAAVAQVEARRQRLPPAYQQRRSIPVSVKTRIGYDEPATGEWIPRLLDARPAVISLHGRTLRQRYAGEAQWDEIAQAAEFARAAAVPLLGNGDIQSIEDAQKLVAATGVDGVLIGRASCGNPFVFCADGQGATPLRPNNCWKSRWNMQTSLPTVSAQQSAIRLSPCASIWPGMPGAHRTAPRCARRCYT